jgi:transcriptional regulator with XRE-family HTH domain
MDTTNPRKQRVQLRAGVLRQIVAQRNLSLGDIAVDAGIDPAHFSSILNGKRPAGPGVRRRLCRALKMGFDDLFEITP